MGRPFSVPAGDRFRATAWRFGGYRTKHVGFVVTFQRRRRGDRTQREAGPFGVTPPSYPRRHGERRDACEPSGPTSVSVNASCARGPDNPHVSPIGGGLGRLPTMPPIGFSCALKGSCCQQRGPAASTATTTDTTAPKTQTTSPTTPDFRRFSPRWSALWAPHHLKPRPHRHQTGGNGVIRTTTRRRHADRQPLMLQNPHRHRRGGHRGGPQGPGPAAPERSEGRAAGRGARGRRGRTTIQRADRSSRRGRPKRAAPTPPPAKFRMQFPRSTNRHKLKNRRISTIRTQSPTCAHGNCMRNCWLAAIAGHQGDAPNHTSAH